MEVCAIPAFGRLNQEAFHTSEATLVCLALIVNLTQPRITWEES